MQPVSWVPSSRCVREKQRSDWALPAEIVGAIEGVALRRPAPTIAFIHRRICDVALDRGLPAPGYSTVRSVVAAIDPGLRTIALEGDAAYRRRSLWARRSTTVRIGRQTATSSVP